MSATKVLRYIWKHPANRGRRVRTLGRGILWQLSKRLWGATWDVPIYGGGRIRCRPGSDGAGVLIYTNGVPDPADMQFLHDYLRPGDAFLDIGANIGVYSVMAGACVGEQGRVLAVEAGKGCLEHLRENLHLNGLDHVEVRFLAVADFEGEVPFLQDQDLMNRLAIAELDAEHRVDLVPCTRLDDLAGDECWSMGKMDIEGAEPLAFRGATRMLQAGNPPVWLIEIKDRLLQRFGFRAAELAETLREHDFDLGFCEGGEVHLVAEPWHDRENVLAIHGAALESTMARVAEGRRLRRRGETDLSPRGLQRGARA